MFIDIDICVCVCVHIARPTESSALRGRAPRRGAHVGCGSPLFRGHLAPVCMYINVYIYIYIYINICIYIYTYI